LYLGDPINAVKIFKRLGLRRAHRRRHQSHARRARRPDYALIEEFASEAFMPLAYGGGINSVEQVRRILSIGN